MVNLRQIKDALMSLDGTEKAHAAECIEEAMNSLRDACAEMDEINVKGKDNVDKLLGCMLGVGMIIGKETDDGR